MRQLIENGKRVLGKTITAILLACLLGAVVYYSPIGNVLQGSCFAFVLARGADSSGSIHEKITFDESLLAFSFTFANGSSIREPDPLGTVLYLQPEYHGEFNATALQEIFLYLFHLRVISLPKNVTCSLDMSKDTTISAVLNDTGTIDLGTYECINETYVIHFNSTDITHAEVNRTEGIRSCSGYWKPPSDWLIDADQLCSMLKDSGKAFITFEAALNVDIKYEITMGSITETGKTNVRWEGIIGAIEIAYDQGNMAWVKYDFWEVRLILLTQTE